LISWTFGCPGHGKGTWDGLGGIIKNTTGHWLKAMDSFIATKKEVFDIIHQLFASKEATERFNSMPHVKIKEWIVRWVADADIVRPIKKITKKLTKEEQAFRKAEKKNTADANAAMRVRYKQMNLDEKRIHNNLEKEKKALEKKQKEEKEEAELASALEARTLATSTGEEVLEEAVEDDNWKKSTSSSCKYISFDIARVVAQVEPGEEGEMYRVNTYTQLDGGNHYQCKDALQNAIVSHSRVRYILADNILQDNGTILVDKDCLEAIVFNCFNGVREESL
jgi:hypothetical protein